MKRKRKLNKKSIRRKCYNCGKMATDPLVYHVVPSYGSFEEIPIYQKNELKTNRIDLRGSRRINAYNYCDIECCESHSRI
ncbi:hypothetical protein H8D04_00455 [bacterium]|nr:hypothetical protein [bacterium]